MADPSNPQGLPDTPRLADRLAFHLRLRGHLASTRSVYLMKPIIRKVMNLRPIELLFNTQPFIQRGLFKQFRS